LDEAVIILSVIASFAKQSFMLVGCLYDNAGQIASACEKIEAYSYDDRFKIGLLQVY